MQDVINFARALADATRWRIIHLVFDQSLCVCELVETLKLPQSTLSSQLRVIDKAGILDCERRGKWLFYRVKPEFRAVLTALFDHFGSTRSSDPQLGKDATKALQRIQRREKICCPGPDKLACQSQPPKP